MKQDTGIGMELEDVKGSMDYRGDHKVDAKIKLDNPAENSEGISFDDGVDVDSVLANYEDQVCADGENGLKPDAMLVDGHSLETVLDNGSGKATIMADEVLESVEGGAEVISTSCGNGDPVSSCVTKFVEPTASGSKDVGVRVASANENEASRHPDLATDASLGIESGGKIHEIYEKPHMGSPIFGTDNLNASITSSKISNSDSAPVSSKDTMEESKGHAAHPLSSFPGESLARYVNLGLECEPGVTFNNQAFDGAAQVDTHGEDQEMHDQEANGNVSAADSTIAQSHASLRHDTDTHEQPPSPDELPLKCVNQQLECELDTSVVCLEKDTTNGLAQGVSKEADIQDTQRQVANLEEIVSINAASARMENITELHNHATSVIVDTEIMHAEPEKDITVNKSTPIQDTEATDVFIDVSEVMNSCTAPNQDDNEECEGCVVDEQHLLLNESLVGSSGQQEAVTSVGECFVKGARDDVTLDGINMEGQHVLTPIQQIERPIEKFVNESPKSDSVKPHNKAEVNAEFKFSPDQHVELSVTSFPIQQVQFPQQVHEDTLPDSENPQSNGEENARQEVFHRQQDELTERATSAQQLELLEEQIGEDHVCDFANLQNNDERSTKNESTPTQQVESPNTAVLTQQVLLTEKQEVDADPVSDSANIHNMNEENARHVSTSSQQDELPKTAGPTQHIGLLENRKDGVPFSDSEIPQSKGEENAGHETIFTQHVELPETAVTTLQIDLPEDQINEYPVSDPANPQSIDESNARNNSTPSQHVRSEETAAFTQQIELPEEQKVEDTVSDSVNPQNMDEDNATNEYTPSQPVDSPDTAVPSQPVDLPETAVPAQPAELPELQEVNEGPVFGCSASPQSMDEDNVRHESASSQQEMELPDTAVPTQQVEPTEEQEEDRVSDSASPRSMDKNNTRNESIPIQQVNLSEAAVSSQQVELPEEQAVDEDTVSDSENPQSMDEDDAGNGSTPTQQIETPETAVSTEQIEFPEAPEVDECPFFDSANPQSKFEKHAASVCTPQQVESSGTVVSAQRVELFEENEVDENCVSDSAKPRSKDERRGRRGSAKPGGSVRNHRVTYRLPPEDDSVFSVFDLVWGKVKSHPWWPGQIFHPSDSSEKAMKYYKKDCHLVAYFGDRSFAWNDASVLKSFRNHFSQEEKQSTTESFQNAVKCALSEISRRVELGLACSCISGATYDKIKYQIVENGGIREELSKRECIDRSSGPETFHSDKLVEYVRALATSPTSGADRLDLVIAKAQLLAFNRLKGCDVLAEFKYYDGLTEFDPNSLPSGEKGMLGESEFGDLAAADDDKTKLKGPRKRKHNLKDIVYQRRKEKSLTELMGESMYYLDGEFDSHEEDDIMLMSPRSGLKGKASGYLAGDFTTPRSAKAISFANVSNTVSSNPQQSFKVGECIRRVASQLTGTSSIMKSTSDGSDSKVIGDDVDEVIDAPDDSVMESTMVPQKQSSTKEMISQLHLSALDPMKGYSFLGDIISFFYEFRNTAVSAQRQKMRKGPGRKRKASAPAVGSPEAFEFDDKNDSYWTDMVVQKDSEAKPARRGRKRKENQVVAVDSEKPLQSKRKKYTRKQYFHESHEPSPDVPARDEKQDQLPTELMLNFGDVGFIPSVVNLNKMFRHFGPLKESETEIDAQNGRARVVFKKRSDAEVAYSSAAMFNVFGSSPVTYQVNYTPSAPFGTSPLALTDTVKHGT